MDSFQSLKAQADQKLKVADHLLSTTYSIVKEPKLLVSVIENMFHALDLSITAVLEYEKSLHNISSYGDSFESRIEIFRRKFMPRHGLNHDIIEFIVELKNTIEEHKKSSVEFAKKEKFVISDNDYNLRTLDLEDVKKRFVKSKKYVEELFALAKLEN